MTSPEITIAIPIYNVEKYIEKSLRSALDQDFSLSYEILIVDDRGIDRSIEIVEQIKKGHPKGELIRIIQHENNLGLGEARNTAIDHAYGKYLFFLDSDDWITSDCLAHLYALAEKHKAEVVAGSTNEVKDGEIKVRYLLNDMVINHKAAGVWMNAEDIFMNIEVWNKLFLLDFLRKNSIRTSHRIMEDSIFDFNVRALAQTIVLSSQITLNYNIHDDSILGNLFGHKATDEAIHTYCDIIKITQQLISEKYHDIVGIYDLYCLRVFYAFYSIKKMQLTKEQEQNIKKNLQGFLSFIPGMKSLKQGAFRCAWLASRIKGEDWRIFEYVYDRRYTREMHYLKKILLWF